MVGPLVAAHLLGVGGAILVFIIVFSALASSLDSLLAATGDFITQDIYHGHINKTASEAHLRKVAQWVIISLGVVTWLMCLPRITTLASLLYFMGPFVASAIWPIISGLYSRRANATAASLAMVFGTAIGLYSYFAIGFYVAALVGAFISMLIVLLGMWWQPADFDWQNLNQARHHI